MAIIPILASLLKAAELAKKIKEVLDKVIPEPPKDIEDTHRWYQCTIKNATQFDLLLNEDYIDSGRYWIAPGTVGIFDQMVFSGCNKDRSPFTGVFMGLAFSTILDKEHTFPFAIGLTALKIGGFKAGVAESRSAKDGYEAASDNGNSITSENKYKAQDKDGNPMEIEFHISAYPGREMKIVVTQTIVRDASKEEEHKEIA